MDCNVIRDLIPLYIDGCCSEESERAVREHVKSCAECKRLLDDMSAPSDIVLTSEAPKALTKINELKASVLQSVLLYVSFALITVGVALEAEMPTGLFNGFWAFNLVIPATGFMLSLANWYFVRLYKSRRSFSDGSVLSTLAVTVCAYIWALFHYEIDLVSLFSGRSFAETLESLNSLLFLYGTGMILSAVLCVLSGVLSDKYAKMLGKE